MSRVDWDKVRRERRVQKPESKLARTSFRKSALIQKNNPVAQQRKWSPGMYEGLTPEQVRNQVGR